MVWLRDKKAEQHDLPFQAVEGHKVLVLGPRNIPTATARSTHLFTRQPFSDEALKLHHFATKAKETLPLLATT